MKGWESVLLAATMLALIGLVLFSQAYIWTECRSAGHSWFYCVRMVAR